MKLAINVISDVICPWCYVGKRRLEKAIADSEMQRAITVHWLPFQLNPAMPKEGVSRREYRTMKFGSWERSLELDAKIVVVGKAEGIPFDFDRMERTPNTVDAHRLIWQAGQHGCQDAVVEALFRAYFTAGRDISHRPTLIDVAVAAGLERQHAAEMLDSDAGMNAIKEAEGLSRRHRVEGVPFFIINNAITLSGAQPPDAFVDAFRQAAASASK